MPDPATPQGTEPAPKPSWEKDQYGNLLIDGVVIQRGTDAYEGPEDDEEKEAAAKPTEPEPATPVKEPESASVPEVAKPVEPERQKFKLKVQGEEVERELTREELIARLQMAEDYQRKTSDLAEQRRKIEPFMPIIEKPEFKEWISQQVEAGIIEAPKTAPPPSPEDVIGLRLRQREPEFHEVQGMMTEWAATLQPYEWDILNSNPRVFNETYDRFKATWKAKVQADTPSPPPTSPTPDPKVIEQNIKAKEISKTAAKVETPGGQPPEADPKKEWKKVDRELKKAVNTKQRFVVYNGKQMEPDIAWIIHRDSEPI